jgi:hypothetical protein
VRQLKTAEERIRDLLSKYSFPPVEVIIPILEKSGRGEQELAAYVYDQEKEIVPAVMKILGLKERNLRTVARAIEAYWGAQGLRFQSVELSDSKFSFTMSICPMLQVGKDASPSVKEKFCDLICSAGATALNDIVLSPKGAICTWNKALIKGANKCTLTFESTGE